MMNSLFFSGAIKGRTDLINLFYMRKKGDFFFLTAEDITNIAIGSGNLQSEAGTDQPRHISNWWGSAPFHSRNGRENSRGTHALLLADPTPAGSADETSRHCRARRADPPAEVEREEGQGSTRSDCLPPLTTAGTWTLANSTAVSA